MKGLNWGNAVSTFAFGQGTLRGGVEHGLSGSTGSGKTTGTTSTGLNVALGYKGRWAGGRGTEGEA